MKKMQLICLIYYLSFNFSPCLSGIEEGVVENGEKV